jgi:hypothetical protein
LCTVAGIATAGNDGDGVAIIVLVAIIRTVSVVTGVAIIAVRTRG